MAAKKYKLVKLIASSEYNIVELTSRFMVFDLLTKTAK